jgi:RNA polymerase sigma factor (sigma-70 family)
LKDGLQTLLDCDGARLFALLTRLTLRYEVAHELFQQLFLHLAGAEGFRRAVNPSAYATRTAINLAFAWRRNQRVVHESLENEPVDRRIDPLDRLIDAEQIERTLAAMQYLSELVREAMVLRFVEDLSYDQCGERMQKSAQQVRGLCHAGVRQLRERLVPKDFEPLRQVRHE